MNTSSPQPQDAHTGHHFQPQSVVFNTVKSVGASFALASAFTLSLLKIVEYMHGEHIPNRWLLSAPLAVGAYAGAVYGNNRMKHTQIYNDKTAALNKYQSLPAIQSDLYAEMGGLDYHYKQTKPEKYLRIANHLGLSVWFGSLALNSMSIHNHSTSSRWAVISNAIINTTLLAMVGADLAHVFGLNRAQANEQERIGFAEKIALQRAAARIGTPAQAV